MVYLSLRSERLCSGPGDCPDAPEPEDGEPPQRCAECPMLWLEDQMSANSRKGALLQRALEIDAALQYGVGYTLDDIDCQEWKALKLIRLERATWEKEEEADRNR